DGGVLQHPPDQAGAGILAGASGRRGAAAERHGVGHAPHRVHRRQVCDGLPFDGQPDLRAHQRRVPVRHGLHARGRAVWHAHRRGQPVRLQEDPRRAPARGMAVRAVDDGGAPGRRPRRSRPPRRRPTRSCASSGRSRRARDPGRTRAAGYQGAFSSTNRPPRTTATYVRGWSTSRALVMLILPSGVWKFLIVLSASVILVRCVRMLSPPARLARRIASATTCAPAYAWAANWLGSRLYVSLYAL